jgi:cytochrome P450
MCFGENIDNKKMEKIENIQKCLISSSGKFSVLNFYPKIVSRLLFRKRWQELSHLRKFQNDLLVELIRSRKKVIENNNYDDAVDNNDGYVVCYVDTLLNLQLPEEKRKLDEGEIVALCSEFRTAGKDTTSTTIEWVMANLVKNKHMQQRLVEEIEDVVGDDREEMEVREEDLEKLPYLKALILEGLRRHPPSHYAIPHAVTEDVILNGYFVPKNGTVNFMVADIGLDPTVWKDPMVFKPERFLKDKDKNEDDAYDISGKKEIKMMSFGAGRRICPAYKLAMLHLEYFVANLVWNFEWKTLLFSDNVDLSEKQEFTMVMKHSLQARISQRN